MQQRQLRLGDILDDYCPRERRVTNHAVVAMVGDDVKQTRCTTCDTEHEFKHAKVPRQRRKADTPAALYTQVLANGPKRVAHEPAHHDEDAPAAALPDDAEQTADVPEPVAATNEAETPLTQAAVSVAESPLPQNDEAPPADDHAGADADADAGETRSDEDEGPIHRRLIRAALPRPEGQQPPARPIPEFTIRQPAGRPNRFRPRNQRSGGPGFGAGGPRSNGNVHGGPPRGMRPGGSGRPPQPGNAPQRMSGRRHGPGGRKRSK
jgi:hypothetical protein